MTIFGTLAMVIGPAIAKAIFSSWLHDATLANAVGGEIVDTIKGAIAQRSDQRKAQVKIETIGGQIAEALRLLAEREAAHVDESGRSAIGHALADTLRSANLTSELLVGFNLDQNRLTRHLSAANPDATHGLSGEEQALYGRMLIEVSRLILEITPQLEDFALAFPKATLQHLDSIAGDVRELRQQPERAMSDFEKRYREAVVEDLDRMETFGLPRMSRVTTKQRLSMAYITLSAARRSDENRDRSAASIAEALSEELVATSRHGMQPHRHSHRVDQALAECTRLVIRGDAGAGKSTLLQWLAVHAANRAFPTSLSHWNLGLPFFIRLRSWVDKGFPSPEDFVRDIAKNFVATMPQGWVQQQLDDGALVLIDGVDELPRSQRDDLLSKLQRLVRDFPNVRYIITSRPTGLKGGDGELWQEWEEWAQEESFVNLTLEPMTISGIEEFITRWHEALAAARRDEDRSVDLQRTGSNLQRLLRQRLDLRKLATNPLLCAMICALHLERGETLPAGRITLYKECIDMLLSRRDEARKIKLDEAYPAALLDEQKWEAIQSFAYWLMDNGYSSVEIDRADAHFERLIPSLRLPGTVTGSQIRAFFVERAGLLREPVIGHVDFMHRTFQEFLAAREALDMDKLGALVNRAIDDQWREVIILVAGLARPSEREELLIGLIRLGDENPDYRHHLHLLAVACLETAVRISVGVSYAVIERAKALLPPQDADEVKLVAKAGNAIVPFLAPSRNYSDQEAARCVEALAQIGTSAAMALIASYAEDTRELVVDAIGAAWGEFDRAEYARSVLSRTTKVSITKLESWEGFEYLDHLTDLLILEFGKNDLSPLTRLTCLNRLGIATEEMYDISPLVTLPNLRELIIGGHNILDLKPLESLVNVSTLIMVGMTVNDFSPLTHMGNLKELWMSEVVTDDLTTLLQLRIKTLFISKTNITEFDQLAGLTDLETLAIDNIAINDVKQLTKLRNVKSLFLVSTGVKDLIELKEIKNLISLRLDGNMVEDLGFLKYLQNISRLEISEDTIRDISPIEELHNLRLLSLGVARLSFYSVTRPLFAIRDINPLASLPKLAKLHISNTNVKDLSPLKHMTNLQLDASSTPALVEQWRSFGGQVVDIWEGEEE